jgi:SAM-dependent methyltransferase
MKLLLNSTPRLVMKYIISFLIRYIPRKYLQLFSHIGLKLLSVFYLGSGVECSVCHKKFRKFLPYGRVSRPNALCPNCLALERHRLLWLYLKERTGFFQEELRFLHVAPEICFIDRFEKLPNLDYVTGDIESPLAKVKMDIHQIPFEDNSFDCTMCNHVMEHVEDDIKAMQELHRILKPGGWAIIQIPFFEPIRDTTYENAEITAPSEREKHFGQSDHVRMYGKDYPERLRQAGFEVHEDTYVQEFPNDLVKKYALPLNEVIYFCKKAQ